jgi:hypothetical protein
LAVIIALIPFSSQYGSPLETGHDLAAIGLVPAPVEVLGDRSELDDEAASEVLGMLIFFRRTVRHNGSNAT